MHTGDPPRDDPDRDAAPAPSPAGGGAPGGHTLPELVAVMERLLAPDGCPWDREQTLHTLIPFVIEEAYEVVDAIEHGTPADHREELGDLLMQIVFQSALRRAEGAFSIDDVIAGIRDKLVRRHPHVFGEVAATGSPAGAAIETAEQVLAQWDRIKAREKQDRGERRRILDAVPRGMAPLERAHELMRRAARAGFDWPDAKSCRGKLDEEVAELDAAIAGPDPAAVHAELGDLLLAVVNLGRHLGCDPAAALRDATHRFCSRFAYIEDRLGERGRAVQDADMAELDALWDEAKDRAGGGSARG